ncbi:MAG: 4Fe-4S binding protein [Bacteroidota bacterium]
MKICPKHIPKLLLFLFLFSFTASLTAQDDFLPFDSAPADSTQITEDSFEEFDEFESFEESELSDSATTCNGDKNCCAPNRNKNLYWVLAILGFTMLAGIFVRYKTTRNLRGFFLVAALVVLGFYRGACPCPISSFHNVFLIVMGVDVPWQSLIWFLALIPITYLFGKVYCGWICHLGALQEFIYLPAKIKIMQGEKAQKIMRGIRILFLVALVVQLLITKTNIFKHYDPFKVAFNLIGTNTLSWVLLGLLLVSSVFIYRPFCKTVCPIGLMLGWVSKIPGASVVGTNGKCTGCKTCNTTCKIRAITRDEKFSKLDNQECIGCGDCVSSCNKNALGFFRNNKKTHHDQIACQRQES